MNKDFQNVKRMFDAAKVVRDQRLPIWEKVSKFVGIAVDTNYFQNNNAGNKAKQLDEFVDDPTGAISANQFGDQLVGIMWGTGDNAVTLQPSRYVLELAPDKASLKDYFDFATDTLLYQMNHGEAGLNNSLCPYAYDQASFGTSGVGAFPNQDFLNGVSENALLFRNYGVDNMAIKEGKAGNIDIAFVVYNWDVGQIISEFAMPDGGINKKMMAKLPQEIRDAYNAGNFNDVFPIIFGFFPRDNFNPKLKGKRGTKYRGVWFVDSNTAEDFFFEEDFAKRPIAICRQIKIRGDVWGRASGTMLISSIMSVDFMMGEAMEVIEKMNKPPLGATSNAVFGDSVLDTSSDGLTILNSALADATKSIFPLFDVGNPEPLIKYLIPYLNEKIATAFKIDALLDFASAKEMTATESLQRYAIRGKSLAGILMQQKTELLIPLVTRCISILWNMGQLGVDAAKDPTTAKKLKKANMQGRVIPDAVKKVAERGLPWYELRFNNELEKLTRTEALQNLIQAIQAVTAVYSIYPDIIHAIDWYKLLAEINDNLDIGAKIMLTEDQFKAQVAAAAQARQVAMMAQAGTAATQMQKDMADANQKNATAQSTRLQ